MKKSKFQFVDHLWDEKKAKSLDEVGKLVYRSYLLGSDLRVVNTGGGNTSAKITERELAMELAPLVRVNGIAPATVIGGSSMFPRDRGISPLTKHNVAFSENETTASLVNKLARFYPNRALSQTKCKPIVK